VGDTGRQLLRGLCGALASASVVACGNELATLPIVAELGAIALELTGSGLVNATGLTVTLEGPDGFEPQSVTLEPGAGGVASVVFGALPSERRYRVRVSAGECSGQAEVDVVGNETRSVQVAVECPAGAPSPTGSASVQATIVECESRLIESVVAAPAAQAVGSRSESNLEIVPHQPLSDAIMWASTGGELIPRGLSAGFRCERPGLTEISAKVLSEDGLCGTVAHLRVQCLPPPARLGDFVLPYCHGSTWLATEGLNPSLPLDYVALSVHRAFGNPPAPLGSRILSSSGVPCSRSTDRAACLERLARVEQSSLEHGSAWRCMSPFCSPEAPWCGQVEQTCGSHLLATAGDAVLAAATQAELADLLAPIDTPFEAMLLAFDAGYFGAGGVDCSGLTGAQVVEGGFEVTQHGVNSFCWGSVVHVGRDGAVRYLAGPNCAVPGRLTEGLTISRTDSARPSALGEYLANQHGFESGSVESFLRLARELEVHGAPEPLRLAAIEAASDEVRHSILLGNLARRFGGPISRIEYSPSPPRSLETVARENAVEGCVREAFAALVGCYQARTACDAEILSVMGEVSRDEIRHADLARRVALWTIDRLDGSARERVQAAALDALAALKQELATSPPEELQRWMGLPNGSAALRLMTEFERIWLTTGWTGAVAAARSRQTAQLCERDPAARHPKADGQGAPEQES
jgi:hypothetical protein